MIKRDPFSGLYPLRCELCKRGFVDGTELARHMKWHRSRELETAKKSEDHRRNSWGSDVKGDKKDWPFEEENEKEEGEE